MRLLAIALAGLVCGMGSIGRHDGHAARGAEAPTTPMPVAPAPSTTASAGGSFASIPDTVSKEAAELLKGYADPATVAPWPAGDDVEGWKRAWEAREEREAEELRAAAAKAAQRRRRRRRAPTQRLRPKRRLRPRQQRRGPCSSPLCASRCLRP